MTFLILCALIFTSAHADPIVLDPTLAKSVDSCHVAQSSRHVWFFKQWHLGPKLDTTDIKKSETLPQESNQKALYEQLDSLVKEGKLKTLVAEGCGSGEITALKFNGWDATSLKVQADKPDYDSILTSVPLKLSAKYGSKIRVLCGDDDELAKKNALAFSDARGEVVYLTRLTQYKDTPEKAAPYLQDVIALYHLPAASSVDQGIATLKSALRKSIAEVADDIEKRNAHLVDVAAKAAQGTDDIAIVFGGAHAAGVKALLEKKQLGCEVVEPVGYPSDDRDEAKLILRLQELIR